jgi:hypothetical protein
MQPEEQQQRAIGSWTDGVLLIQQIATPKPGKPHHWTWRVTQDGRPMPGKAVSESDFKGLHGGNRTRRAWTAEAMKGELSEWGQEILACTELDKHEKARQLYAWETVCLLFLGAQTASVAGYCVISTLREDTVGGRFAEWIRLYKGTHRQLDNWATERLNLATEAMGNLSLEQATEKDALLGAQ